MTIISRVMSGLEDRDVYADSLIDRSGGCGNSLREMGTVMKPVQEILVAKDGEEIWGHAAS